jgi:hypothetical protein
MAHDFISISNDENNIQTQYSIAIENKSMQKARMNIMNKEENRRVNESRAFSIHTMQLFIVDKILFQCR